MQTFSCPGKLGQGCGNSLHECASERGRRIHVFTNKWSPNIQTEKLYVCVCVRGERSQLLEEEVQTQHSQKWPLQSRIMWKISPFVDISCFVQTQKTWHDVLSHPTSELFQNIMKAFYKIWRITSLEDICHPMLNYRLKQSSNVVEGRLSCVTWIQHQDQNHVFCLLY